MPKFSVIMPSFLGEYKYCASNREEKLPRAIQSVLDQTYDDFELVIVADGCDRTIEIVKENFSDKRIKLFRCSDDRKFGAKRGAGSSGYPRNAGIQQATGEHIIYLDIDDTYHDTYLGILSGFMTDHDWYWFDCLSWNRKTEKFDRYVTNIDVQGQCGTANICHKRIIRKGLGAWWSDSSTYLHDWIFISTLKQISQNYKYLGVAGYQVMHVPQLLDV